MTALADKRAQLMERWTYHLFTLTQGTKAYQGGMVGLDPSTGKVKPLTTDPNLIYIGVFAENGDATSAEVQVNVNLGQEIEGRRWNNDGSITSAMVGQLAYALDDQTVGIDGDGLPLAGRIWDVSSIDGVLVQKLEGAASLGSSNLGARLAIETAIPAFASNDITFEPQGNGLYEIPATTGASTITLNGSPGEGDVVWFSANGTNNAHTVQYRDGLNANAALTAALTASKRHLVACVFLNGVWRANAYVSP